MYSVSCVSQVMISMLCFPGDDFPGRKFRVDPTTGVIQTTSTTLDRETRDRYDLTVAVSDGGIPARTVSRISYIHVLPGLKGNAVMESALRCKHLNGGHIFSFCFVKGNR